MTSGSRFSFGHSDAVHRTARLRRQAKRAARGMALVTTVLLTVLAATIVLAIAAESITATRAESTRSDATSATRIAADAQRSFESALQADPYFYFKTVFASTAPSGYIYDELARTCTNSGYTATVSPGASWTTALANGCTSWTYGAQSATPWSTAPGSAWLRITPPSTGSPVLKVDIMATYGSDSDGLSLSYHLSGSEGYTLWSSSDLVLDNMARGTCSSACSSLTGTAYTAGTMFLPASSSVAISSAELATEQGFTPTPSTTTARYYGPTVSTGPPPVRNVRDLIPTQLSTSTLRASQSEVLGLACPGGTGSGATTDALNSSTDGTSTSLCLTAGQVVRTTTSATVTVPSNVDGYLFIFNGNNGAGTPTVTVYDSVATIAPAGNCTVACDLVTLGTSDTTASPVTAPGDINFWNGGTSNGNALLGTFPLPKTGLIFADKSVYLGACSSTASPTPYLTTNGTCPALTAAYPSTPGMTVTSSATVIAGTSSAPANVYISSSIATAPGVSFGAIASGALVFPYWARPPGTATSTTQSVAGAYTALGYGVPSTASPVTTFPASVDTTNPDNLGAGLTLTGSLAAPSIDLRLQLFSTVGMSGQQLFSTQPPPYFTDFTGTWALGSSTRLNASAACNNITRACTPPQIT